MCVWGGGGVAKGIGSEQVRTCVVRESQKEGGREPEK